MTSHRKHGWLYNPAMQEAPATSRKTPANSLRWLSAAAFAVALTAAFWRAPQLPIADFAAPPEAHVSTQAPLLQHGMLPGVGGLIGAPSLTRLADGRMAIAWLALADAPRQHDVIWFSTLSDGNWSEPYPITSSEEAAGTLFAHIRHLGAPELFAHGEVVHLWLTASGVGGHSIVHTHSDDTGANWSALQRMASSPLTFADRNLTKPPLPLTDGGLALPLGQTPLSARDEWLRLDAGGRIIGKTRLQEEAVPAQWRPASQPQAIAPGRPQALLRLSSGRLLLAGNTTDGAGTLAVWVGNADGSAWQAPRIIETASDADFSEPSLALAQDGGIHLAYGWRHQGIRHLRLNEAWLDREQR